jgi:hypothetical protein
MHEITRARVLGCATRIAAPEQYPGRFSGLTDFELRETLEVLRQERLRRIGYMIPELDPQDLTLEECRDPSRPLRSFKDRRGGVL